MLEQSVFMSLARNGRILGTVLVLSVAFPVVAHGQDGLVKLTPLGSHPGELCARDRAILFEDPTGVRILYDPGFMVDETDPRLGEIHACCCRMRTTITLAAGEIAEARARLLEWDRQIQCPMWPGLRRRRMRC
jgi:hypothetical protein